jgi:hypothetical protein
LDKKILQDFYLWFNNYVRGFYSGDTDIQFNIKLKEEHTLRVCDNIIAIGNSVGLSGDSLLTAETTALFHDVGRFRQFMKYRTFSDSKSENHAILGINVLEEFNVLNRLSDYEKEIMLKAIKYHNICTLPEGEDEQCILFSKLLRDADKLDIFDILVKYYEKPELYPHIKVGEASDIKGYSENIVSDVLNCRNILYSDIKTANDMKLLRLSWIFDINFKYTLLKIKECGFVERIIKSLPSTEETLKISKHIEEYIYRRL